MKHLFTLILLGSTAATLPVAAQNLTNDGGSITLTKGSVIFVPGNVSNKGGGTLDLGPGGQLQIGGNFTNAGTIVPGTGSVLLNGTANQVLDLGGNNPIGAGPTAATLYDLTINNTTVGTAITVPSSIAVAHQINVLAGQVLTDQTATVTLLDGAMVVGETSGHYIAGNLRTERIAVSGNSYIDFNNGARLNPTGNTLGNVAIVRSAGLNIANISYGVNPLDGKKGIDQIWRVIPATQPTTTPLNLELSWLSVNDNGLISFNSTRMWRRNGAGWLAVGNGVNASSRTIAQPILGMLDQITVSNSSAPLPVELTTFTAAAKNLDAQLAWNTAQEKNNDHFNVERSLNGTDFTKIGEVRGQGSKTTPTDYTFTDASIGAKASGTVYYRLQQVDTDGTATFSPVRTVQFSKVITPAISLAPNPATTGTQLDLSLLPTGRYEVLVLDATGRKVLSATLEAGSAHALDLSRVASGSYHVVVRGQNNGQLINLTKRLIKE